MESMEQGPIPLTAREAASGLLGSVSMTCWFFLLVCLTSAINQIRTSKAKVGTIHI